MGWTLAPGVGFCFASDQLIFLDLRTDRYLALCGGRRAAFDRLRAREANDSKAMTDLLATGFFVQTDGENRLDPVDVEVPATDLTARRRSGIRLPMVAAAARDLYWARRALAPDRLATTVAGLQQRKETMKSDPDPSSMAELAASYASSRTLVPVPPRCLVDSLALFRLTLRHDLAPTMIFGVRLAPFAAHCWLQSSEHVLTGSVDDAHNFTPILAL